MIGLSGSVQVKIGQKHLESYDEKRSKRKKKEEEEKKKKKKKKK